MSKTYVVSDWHLNHGNIKTYCQRPDNFTELIEKRHNETVKPEDFVIVLGDILIGNKRDGVEIIRRMNGRKFLVRGNHDRDKSCDWWMRNGFDFAGDQLVYRHVLFTHEPYVPQWDDHLQPLSETEPRPPRLFGGVLSLPHGCEWNIHGHLHNIWEGFGYKNGEHVGVYPTKLWYPWQRLFALEYTNYRPVELGKFLARPEAYQSMGPRRKNG